MKKAFEFLALVSLLCLALAGCSDNPGTTQASSTDSATSGALARPQSTSAVPVVVAHVQRTSLPVELHAIGTGQAFKTVSVESQVAGIIKQVFYRQGQFVHRGDLLLKLDDSPFVAALAQAQAALAKDSATANLDRVELRRYNQLYNGGITSKEQSDEYLASSMAADAAVRADEAAVQTAKIQLSYCSIYAPIGGVTGAQLVYPGATVQANSAPVLVVINQVSPIYVNFSVPQQYLEAIKRTMARSRLKVEATPTGDTVPEIGDLTFVNNTVDPSTGTIELMASFANSAHRLWPGQFANVVLRLGEQQNVLVVPSQAVQTGQQGNYVFVVRPDMTVAAQSVKVGQATGTETEVLQGLSPGDTVVTDGQVSLAPGTKVYFTRAL